MNNVISLINSRKIEDIKISQSAFKEYIETKEFRNLIFKKLCQNILLEKINVVNGIFLLETDGFDVTMSIKSLNMPEEPKNNVSNPVKLSCLANNMFFYVLSDGEVKIRRYKTPKNHNQNEYKKDTKIEYLGTETYSKGGMICVQSGVDVVEFKEFTENTIILELSSYPIYKYVWHFSMKDYRFLFTSHSKTQVSRVVQYLEILNSLEKATSFDPLENLCSFPEYSVRWTAVKTLYKYNSEKAIEKLKEMARHDSSSLIRSAAEKTLVEGGYSI